MSMFGDIAVEGYIGRVIAFLESKKDQPAEETLRELIAKLKADKKSAHDGWL